MSSTSKEGEAMHSGDKICFNLIRVHKELEWKRKLQLLLQNLKKDRELLNEGQRTVWVLEKLKSKNKTLSDVPLQS